MTHIDNEQEIISFCNEAKKFYNIYRIYDINTDESYYGSTCRSIRIRLQEHESDYRSYLKGNREYITSYEIIKNNNYEVVLVQRIRSSATQAKELEGTYIKGCECVNKLVPGRTSEQYNIDNKARKQQYRQDTKEDRKRTRALYRESHKQAIKERSRQYGIDNKEKIQQYYQDNRAKKLQKYDCECGGKYIHQNKLRHSRSKKHQQYMNNP